MELGNRKALHSTDGLLLATELAAWIGACYVYYFVIPFLGQMWGAVAYRETVQRNLMCVLTEGVGRRE